jgi:type IV pilus assembly protein PilC
MVDYMISIGEETGNIEDMLNKCADYYDEEVDMATQAVMAAMEPMITLVLAGVVGTIIGACMAPMVTMYSSLGNL